MRASPAGPLRAPAPEGAGFRLQHSDFSIQSRVWHFEQDLAFRAGFGISSRVWHFERGLAFRAEFGVRAPGVLTAGAARATQVPEPLALVPLTKFAPEEAMLVGDPRQLAGVLRTADQGGDQR